MKHYLHVYGCLIGLFWVTLTQAQVPGRSRLELGRKTSPAPVVVSSKTQRALLPASRSITPMDRLLSQSKNSVMRDYYRSLLIATPASATKSTTGRTLSVAEGTVASTNAARTAEEPVAVTGIESMYSSDRMAVSNVYPNPAHDVAEIDYVMKSSVGSASITVLSMFGAPVSEYTLDRNERKVRLQTRDLPNGFYFYQLAIDGEKVATKKLQVRHQ